MNITISAAWLAPLLPVLGCVYLTGWRHGFASAKEIAAPALDKLQRILNGEKPAGFTWPPHSVEASAQSKPHNPRPPRDLESDPS